MTDFLKQINERTESVRPADMLVNEITAALPVEEMRTNRGSNFSTTQSYQLRIKPKDRASYPLENIQQDLEKFLNGSAMKGMGVSNVSLNQRSANSGKFSSVSFKFMDVEYDVVIALGGNAGEHFEKDMLFKMDSYLTALGEGGDPSDETHAHARAAFDALREVDSEISLKNVSSVTPRSGTTQRSGTMTPEETGAIIADIIIHLKNGKKKYVSLKNANGSTVAQFGVTKAFNDDFTCNTNSVEWKTWLAPFNLDVDRIAEGFAAARDKTEVDWDDIEHTSIHVKPTHPIFKIMQQMWGSNYYYLREKGSGFYAVKIDRDYIDNEVLAGLTVTEIRYPSKARKQITISLQSEYCKFKFDIRNPRGAGHIRPTQIQLSVGKILKK